MKKKLLFSVFALSYGLLSACGGSQAQTESIEAESAVAVEESVEAEESEVESTAVEEEVSKYEASVYEVIDGNVITLDINYPEGYYLDESTGSSFHRLYTPLGHTLQIMAADDEESAAYDNYVSTGAWSGTKDWAVETIIAESSVDVPIGTVTVITGEDEKGRVTDHGFIEYEGVLWYVSRELLYYADTADEIDGVISAIFSEKELQEVVPVIEIANTEPEITDGLYQYCLRRNVFNRDEKINELKNIFGFNYSENALPLFSIHESDECIYSYEFNTGGGSDSFKVAETGGENIAFLKEYMTYGTYTPNAKIHWDGAAMLQEMALGDVVNTPYGELQIIYSRWDNSIADVREFALLNVYDYEIMVLYEVRDAGVDTLDNYEGKLKDILATMF